MRLSPRSTPSSCAGDRQGSGGPAALPESEAEGAAPACLLPLAASALDDAAPSVSAGSSSAATHTVRVSVQAQSTVVIRFTPAASSAAAVDVIVCEEAPVTAPSDAAAPATAPRSAWSDSPQSSSASPGANSAWPVIPYDERTKCYVVWSTPGSPTNIAGVHCGPAARGAIQTQLCDRRLVPGRDKLCGVWSLVGEALALYDREASRHGAPSLASQFFWQ